MNILEAVVLQSEKWIERGIPDDVMKNVGLRDIITQNMRNIAKRIIGRPIYKRIKTRDFFWEQALIIDGLIAYYNQNSSSNAKQIIIAYYSKALDYKQKGYILVFLTDQIMHAQNILWLIKNGETQFKPILEEAVEFIKDNINEHGFLPYAQATTEILYVDALGMICPFCVEYGTTYGDDEILELGITQMKYHLSYALDNDLKLPYHGVDLESKTKMGNFHWGRGIGWMLYGLSGIIEHLPSSHPQYDSLKNYYLYLSKYIINNFGDGKICNDLLLKEHIDTSAITMIGASLAVGIRDNVLPTKHIVNLEAFINETIKYISEDGNVNSCSKECMGIGSYSKEYGRFCAQGPTIKMMSIMKEIKNNVSDR